MRPPLPLVGVALSAVGFRHDPVTAGAVVRGEVQHTVLRLGSDGDAEVVHPVREGCGWVATLGASVSFLRG